MGDQRVKGRSAFGLINLGNRLAITGYPAKPINRLCGKSDQLARTKAPCCLCYVSGNMCQKVTPVFLVAVSQGNDSVTGMCGRFTLTTTNDELMHRFGLKLEQNLRPRYNIAPTQNSLVLRAGHQAYLPVMAHFGLSGQIAGKTLINARSETVAEKPTFADAFRQNRCLVLADGWYEWDAARTPYHIHLKDRRVMALAGLLFRRDNESHFVIVTAAAQGKMAAMHHRTPLVLPKQAWWPWLAAPASEAQQVMKPPSDAYFDWFEVGKAVGKVANDTPDLMQPADTDLFG